MVTKGFTLLELLIVVGIIAIFSGMTISRLNGQSDKKGLEKEMSKLTDTLQLAQKNAVSGESCSNYTGYQMSVVSTGYTVYKCCGACVQAANIVTSYTFQTGTGYSIVSGTGSFLFRVLGGGTDLTSTKNIYIKNAYIDRSLNAAAPQCMTISVQPNGLVSSSNTLVACP